MLALNLYQCLLFSAEEAGILDFFTRGERGKGLKSHIDAHCLSARSKTFRLTLHRETDGPLARRGTRDGTGLEYAFDRAMVDHLETANLGETHAVIVRDTEATLRKSETIVAVFAAKSGVARFLARFRATKERFECQVDTDGNVLQNLRVDPFEGGALLFQKGKGVLLLIKRKAFALLLIRGFAHFQQVVIEPTALVKCLIEHASLLFCGIYPIFVGFTHGYILAQNSYEVKQEADLEEAPFIPALNN